MGVGDSLGYAVMSDVIWSWVGKVLPGPITVH
jgi:hypothetical protein